MQTLEALVADADSTSGAVAMPAAQLGTGFSDVDVVDGPALLLSFFPFLDPAELCGTERPKENKESQQPFLCLSCPASACGNGDLRKELKFLHKTPPKQRVDSSSRWVMCPHVSF